MMLIIPEISTILILTPRTGSGSIKRAVLEVYPNAMLLYRHMEADGVPRGYDRWKKIGVIRHPLDRMWSLYKFLTDFKGPHNPEYIKSMRKSVDRPFDDWLLNNEVVFTSPYDSSGSGRYYPHFTVNHPLPENRKSQFHYLRPDLGTEIWRFDQLHNLSDHLGIKLKVTNNSAGGDAPVLGADARGYIDKVFEWDFNEYGCDT